MAINAMTQVENVSGTTGGLFAHGTDRCTNGAFIGQEYGGVEIALNRTITDA